MRFEFFKFSRDLTLVTWSKGHVALRVGVSHVKSASCLVRCPWVFCECRYNVIVMWPRNITSLRGHGYGWELLVICHHPDKFGDRKHCDIGDMFLICQLTSRDHMFKGLCEPMGGSPWPPCHWFGGHWSSWSGDIKYFICHVTSQNQVIEGSRDFFSRSSHCMSPPCQVWWP